MFFKLRNKTRKRYLSYVSYCHNFSVPTLIKWGTKLKLEEGQLMKEDMVKMMLED